jgi:reactive intermediate/imine deaminase
MKILCPSAPLRGAAAALATVAALAGAPATATAQTAAEKVVYHQPNGVPQNPFSPAVQVGKIVFLAGQIGTKDGTLVTGGIEAETKQTMENIKATLGAIGLTMDDLVKCTVFLADMDEWGRMNAIYRTYFQPTRYPARSAFGANGLALGARVEIECVAAAR